jgi:hypothetical protein
LICAKKGGIESLDYFVVGKNKFGQSEKVNLFELVDIYRITVFVEISSCVFSANGDLFSDGLDAFLEVISQL